MLFKSLAAATVASLFSSYATAADLPAIEVVGNKFFFSNNGSQFYVRGVAYQADTANATNDQTINDPLADFSKCSRDIPYLQKLNTNVVRVYAINTTLNHDQCMNALNDAGIYVIADLSAPKESIDRMSPSWDLGLYERYTSVVDEFAKYPNVLGFFAGNEVTNNSTNTDASPFVKAAIRDMKAYMKQKNYRSIPVGYSSNDDGDTRVPMADYFACGSSDEKADFYGINMYEWCGDSSFQASGYADRTKDFANLSIPIFFSEYGCNEDPPRKFTEVQALYGKNMTDVWSGGIVYMYFEEANNYGLVSIDSSGDVKTLDDFNYYSSEINSISPTSANTASYSASSTSLNCPATNTYWMAATELPPTPSQDLCDCMSAALSCVVKDDVDEKDYEDLFNYVCAQISCDGIVANGTSGDYGSYSFCNAKDKLSFILNLYYTKNGGSKSNCDFSGSASLQSASTQSACATVLSQIGSSGTNKPSSTVSFSGSKSGSSSASGSSSKSGSGSGSKSGSSTSSGSSGSSTSSGKKNAAVSNAHINLSQVILSSIATISLVAGIGFALA